MSQLKLSESNGTICWSSLSCTSYTCSILFYYKIYFILILFFFIKHYIVFDTIFDAFATLVYLMLLQELEFFLIICVLSFQLYFRDKVQDEEGYILFVRKNALQILIPKYGLEGTLYLNPTSSSITFTYNSEDQSQTCGDIVFRAFDPIIVQLSLDRSNVQHEKLIFKLVKPEVSRISQKKGGRLNIYIYEEKNLYIFFGDKLY